MLATSDTTHFSKARLIHLRSRLRHCPTIQQRSRNNTRYLGTKIAMKLCTMLLVRIPSPRHVSITNLKNPEYTSQVQTPDIGGYLPNVPGGRKSLCLPYADNERRYQDFSAHGPPTSTRLFHIIINLKKRGLGTILPAI